jgi:hypothetical protein
MTPKEKKAFNLAVMQVREHGCTQEAFAWYLDQLYTDPHNRAYIEQGVSNLEAFGFQPRNGKTIHCFMEGVGVGSVEPLSPWIFTPIMAPSEVFQPKGVVFAIPQAPRPGESPALRPAVEKDYEAARAVPPKQLMLHLDRGEASRQDTRCNGNIRVR